MANPHRGEVPFGDYTLVLSVNALCELESAFEIPIAQLFARLEGDGVSITDIRTIVWIGLKERHEELTEKDAGRIIGEVGMTAAGKAIGEAIRASFPEAEAAEARGKSRPRKARA